MRSTISSVATTRVSFWTWISSTRYCELRQEMVIDLNAWKAQLILLEQSNDTGAIDMKMGSSLGKIIFLRCWGCLSLLNWIYALTLSLLLKLPPTKLELWLVLWSFFLLRLPCSSKSLAYSLAWNIVAMFQLVLLAATWKC